MGFRGLLFLQRVGDMTQKECSVAAAPGEDLKETIKEMTEVRLQLREVLTLMRELADHSRRIELLEKLATDTANSSRSAHHRLNDMQATQRWLIGLTVTMVGTGIACATLLIKIIGG
jgi:hypothetical protein